MPAPAPADASDRLRGALLWLLALSPALPLAWLVASHAVNVPVWDDWERASLLEAWRAGTLGWGDLYAPHIDHRIVVPRLLTLAASELSGGDLRFDMALTFAWLVAAALSLHGLLRRSLGPWAHALYGTSFLVNLFVFSPLQWENLVWADQKALSLPMPCLVAALLVMASELRSRTQLLLCLVLAWIATHSFSHGLLLWPAVAAVVTLRSGPRAAGRARFLAAWGVAAALVLVPYFTVGGYRTTSGAHRSYGAAPGERAPAVADMTSSLAMPGKLAHYHLNMVGSPLARITGRPARELAPAAGLLLHAAFLGALAHAVLRRREPRAWNRRLPWLVLGGTALAACAAAGVGRVHSMPHFYALAPRYTGVTSYLLVSLVALAAVELEERRARSPARSRARALVWAALVAGVVGAQLANARVAADGLRLWQAARLRARTALVYLPHFEPPYPERLDNSLEAMREPAYLYDRLGLLHPPLAREPRLSAFEREAEPLNEELGTIDRLRATAPQLRVRGLARLPDGRPADGVLVVHPGEDDSRVVAIGDAKLQPRIPTAIYDHLFDAVDSEGKREAGFWRADVPPTHLPRDRPFVLEAWAVDARRMRAYRLPQRVRAEIQGERWSARIE